nr:MAG TPA: hypothetical protein [Caudoviricetes sp.]
MKGIYRDNLRCMHPFRHISTFRTGAVSERSFFCSVLVTSRIVGWREDFTFLHIVNVL